MSGEAISLDRRRMIPDSQQDGNQFEESKIIMEEKKKTKTFLRAFLVLLKLQSSILERSTAHVSHLSISH